MANNRLYMVRRGEDGAEQILLAKGWASGWQVWEPETLVERMERLLEGDNFQGPYGSGPTEISIEDENTQKDNPRIIRAAKAKS